jgi:hypothetical protein
VTRRRQVLSAVVAVVVTIAICQVAMYNWRITLALRIEALQSELASLRIQEQELENARALLSSPGRLEAVGCSLGLVPLDVGSMALACPGVPVEEDIASLE